MNKLNEKRNMLRKELQADIFQNKESFEKRKNRFLEEIDLKIKEFKEAKKSIKKIKWLK